MKIIVIKEQYRLLHVWQSARFKQNYDTLMKILLNIDNTGQYGAGTCKNHPLQFPSDIRQTL